MEGEEQTECGEDLLPEGTESLSFVDMPWTRPEFSREQVNHAGDVLISSDKAINVSQAVRPLQSNWPAARKMLDGLLDKGILNRNRKPKSVARDTKSVYVLKS
jgi:hypothetical protein